MQRRDVLKLFGGGLLLMNAPSQLLAAQTSSAAQRPLFIWVILRGALDCLHTVIPDFDPHYAQQRPLLAKQLGKGLPLSQGFSLNPALVNLHRLYQQQQMLPIVAVSSGYTGRSHFDGQDYLESGRSKIDVTSGWLARAIEQFHSSGIAIDNTIPIAMRGTQNVNAWFPSNGKEVPEDIYQSMMNMYADDKTLLTSLENGLALRDSAMLPESQSARASFEKLTLACANLLKGDTKLSCAMLEMGGWDTHNNQHNRLNRQLTTLDKGIATLEKELGERWQNTVVAITTEFGRTVKENGTQGTDHGTGSAMILTGGAVKGGQVLGKWPGLSTDMLYEQRDLQPTSDTFSWLSTVLAQHWALSASQVQQIFDQQTPYKLQLVKAKV